MSRHRVIFGSSLRMEEVTDASCHLVVTSPPYWQIKDYGGDAQLGFHDPWERYIRGLNTVWRECWRVLAPGCRLCVNVGDQFARAAIYGRFEVLPIRTEVTAACMRLGFAHMPDIIWRKATTVHPSGGAVVMGSYPYPRNGIPKIDYEFILVFQKPGKCPPPSPEARARSALAAAEWNEYFLGHWTFPGERSHPHLAPFPVELPRRLIRMFTFEGETVLDPFLGSGTTIRAARETGRVGVGYEINPAFEAAIRERLGPSDLGDVSFERQVRSLLVPAPDALPAVLPVGLAPRRARHGAFYGSVVRSEDRGRHRHGTPLRVVAVDDSLTLVLADGHRVGLLGVTVEGLPPGVRRAAARRLAELVLRKRITIDGTATHGGAAFAYVHRIDRTFVNGRLLREGLLRAGGPPHRLAARFVAYEREARQRRAGLWAAAPGLPAVPPPAT